MQGWEHLGAEDAEPGETWGPLASQCTVIKALQFSETLTQKPGWRMNEDTRCWLLASTGTYTNNSLHTQACTHTKGGSILEVDYE